MGTKANRSSSRWALVALLVAVGIVGAACTTPPATGGSTSPNGSISIAVGAPAVNYREVILGVKSSGGATRMRLANGSDPTAAAWQSVAPVLMWTLPNGDGTKTVSAQFSNDDGSKVSAVVLATIVVDTVPPSISFVGSTEGQTVDLGTGAVFALGGDVADTGSGLLRVDVANQGGQRDAVVESGRWTHPVGATASGPSTYSATAIDNAGNSTTIARTLNLVIPPPDQTIVRPGVLNVQGALATALLDDGTDGESLTFSGDRRAALSGVGVLVSAPMTQSPSGLLRRVKTVTYQSSTNRTVVTTEYGTVLDVFAQLKIDTVVPGAAAAPGGTAARANPDCDSFATGRTIGGTFDLPSMGGSFPIPPVGISAGVSADTEIAAYFDLQLDIGIGPFGPVLRQFKVTAGALVCGEFQATTSVTTRDLLGPQFDVGIPYSQAEAQLGIANPSGLTPGWSPLAGRNLLDPILPPLVVNPTVRGLPLAPSLPIPLYWAPYVGVDPIFEGRTSAELNLNGTFAVGAELGIDGTSPFFDPIGTADLVEPSAAARAELSAGIGLKAGIRIGEAVMGAGTGTAEVASAGLALKASVEPTWQGDLVKSSSWVTSARGSVCPELQASAGVKLTLQFRPPWGVGTFKFTVIDVETAEIDIPLGSCWFDRTWTKTQGPPARTVVQIDAADDHACARLSDGSLRCWGHWQPYDVNRSTAVVAVAGIDSATALSSGESGSCVRRSDGTVRCWGGGHGHLGDGTTNISSTPVSAPQFQSATGIAVGEVHSCFLRTSGTVGCVGRNVSGQLGNGQSGQWTPTLTPTTVVGVSGATAVAVGPSFSCAVLAGRTVRCWGAGGDGQLGHGVTIAESTTSVAVTGLTDAVALSASPPSALTSGDHGICALRATGTVVCWGDNGSGVNGDGTTTDRNRPVAVAGLSGVTSVARGSDHACAVLSSGGVRCWGSNASGQLGNGTSQSSLTPVAVQGITNATAVTAGLGFSCALLTGGTVKCWGADDSGQLGNGGAFATSTVPVSVVNL